MAVRVNISVSDSLKSEMDQLDGINWSKVAQEAFATHIRIHSIRAKGNIMEAGIERLIASKMSELQTDHAAGYAAGKMWALQEAQFAQLKRVASLEGERNELPSQEVDPDVPRLIAEAIRDDGRPSWDETVEILDAALGSKDPTDERIAGFMEAVREVLAMIP